MHEEKFLTQNIEKQHEEDKAFSIKFFEKYIPFHVSMIFFPISTLTLSASNFYVASERNKTIFCCQLVFATQDK